MTQFQKLVIQKCDDIKKFLGLNEFSVEYDWDNNKGLNGHPAGTSVDYRYLTISLQLAKEFKDDYNELGNEWLEKTLLHEFLHFFTYLFDAPLKKHLGKKEYALYDEKDEQMIERLTNLIYGFYK